MAKANIANSIMERLWWQSRGLWPKGDRERVFIGEAVHEVGPAMHGENWTGDEPLAMFDYDSAEHYRLQQPLPHDRPPPPAPPVSLSSPSSYKVDCGKLSPELTNLLRDNCSHILRWRKEQDRLKALGEIERLAAAVQRFRDVVEWIADIGRNSEVTTFGRLVVGGGFFHADASEWNVEPLWERRFKLCTFLKSVPNAGAQQAYLFLDRRGLSHRIAGLPHAEAPTIEKPSLADGAHLSPYLRIMIEAARRSGIGPAPEDQEKVETLISYLRDIAGEQGIELSERQEKMMASLLREPEARVGIHKMRSEAKKVAHKKGK